MNEFIEKNKGLLRTYCIGARIIGWVLLVVPSIATVMTLSGNSRFNESAMGVLYTLEALFSNFLLLGLIVLGVAQFIRYLFETGYKPGWILRNASKVLCGCAVIVFLGSFVRYSYFPYHWKISHGIYSLFVHLFTLSIPAVAKALILVGLAQILRRVMPVIEESKTLV